MSHLSVDVSSALIDLVATKPISLTEISDRHDVDLFQLDNNGYVILCSGSQSIIATRTDNNLSLVDVPLIRGFSPRNVGQKLLTHAICNHRNAMTSVIGSAGTGKTLVVLACALYLMQSERGKYKSIVLTKPRIQTTDDGEPMGEIPGTVEEKMSPQMISYENAVLKVLGSHGLEFWNMMIKKGDVRVIPLEFMRGVDFSDAIVICDEAQNCGSNQFASLVTRINESSKLIVMGDVEQVDRKSYNNIPILDYTSHRFFRDSAFTASIELTEIERGRLTKLMVDIMKDLYGR